MQYAEWARLLSGLLPETPLGRIVGIRAETDHKVIKAYGQYERDIRRKWALHQASKMSKEQSNDSIVDLQKMLKGLFGRKE